VLRFSSLKPAPFQLEGSVSLEQEWPLSRSTSGQIEGNHRAIANDQFAFEAGWLKTGFSGWQCDPPAARQWEFFSFHLLSFEIGMGIGGVDGHWRWDGGWCGWKLGGS